MQEQPPTQTFISNFCYQSGICSLGILGWKLPGLPRLKMLSSFLDLLSPLL